MKTKRNNLFFKPGLTLAEVLMAITVGSMIMIAAVGLYSKIEGSAEKIFDGLDNQAIPRQILQRIAEDIDRIVTASGKSMQEIRKDAKRRHDLLYLQNVEGGNSVCNNPSFELLPHDNVF